MTRVEESLPAESGTAVARPSWPPERWDLRSVGARDVVEGWQEMMLRSYVPFDARPAPRPDEAFEASVSRLMLGEVSLVDYACGRGCGRRGRREIAATPRDLVGILAMRSGSLGLTLNGQSMVLAAGNVVVWDGAHEGTFEALGPIAKRTLIVPRERLRAAFPRLDSVIGRVLPADNGALRLLFDYLDTVVDCGPALDPAARAAAGDAAVELARVALGAGVPEQTQRLRDTLVVQVRRYVDAHLGEFELDPRQIADAHAVSVRTLHGAFEETGESVSALIRRRRLERCWADLASGRKEPVTDVALRWGFRETSHFSRVFRTHYGCSPRDLRDAV